MRSVIARLFVLLLIAVAGLQDPSSVLGQGSVGARRPDGAEGAAVGRRRPNILFVVTDDQRPDTIRALGNRQIRTPVLDRLVREGTVFTRAVCAYPICHVSRAEMMTGCTAFRAQVPYATGKLNEELRTLPAALCEAGYRTWHVGKWHVNGKPTERGFDETRGWYTSGGGARPLTRPLDRLGQPVTGYRGWVFRDDDGTIHPELGVGLTPNISELFADAAIELLVRRSVGEGRAGGGEGAMRDAPWFLHLNFTAPHDPRFPPEVAAEAKGAPVDSIRLPRNFAPDHPFDHGNQGGRDEVLFPRPLNRAVIEAEWSVYYALVEHLDRELGRIIAQLEETGELKNTIVVFTSDHGLAIGSHGLTGKQNMYEHSIGVPLVLAGPGVPAGKRVDAQCYLRDLYPTLCELAGEAAPARIDGRSLVPAMAGKPGPHSFVVGYFTDTQRMIRTDEWKLVRYPKAGREQLFRLTTDPDELENLIAKPEHAATVEKLRQELGDWLLKHGDPSSAGAR